MIHGRRPVAVVGTLVVAVAMIGVIRLATFEDGAGAQVWTPPGVLDIGDRNLVYRLSPEHREEPIARIFGTSSVVVSRDGTVFTRHGPVGALDDEALEVEKQFPTALVSLHPDGRADAVTPPRWVDSSQLLRPLCSAADGSLIAAELVGSALVRRDIKGRWHRLTEPHSTLGFAEADGAKATETRFGFVRACAALPNGDLLVAEKTRVRRIRAAGQVVDTIAGYFPPPQTVGGPVRSDPDRETRSSSFAPDLFGGPALGARMPTITGLAVAPSGEIWISSAMAIRKITLDGRLITVVSDHTGVFTEAARITGSRIVQSGGVTSNEPGTELSGLSVDERGVVYVGESRRGLVRRLDLQGRLSLLAEIGSSADVAVSRKHDALYIAGRGGLYAVGRPALMRGR